MKKFFLGILLVALVAIGTFAGAVFLRPNLIISKAEAKKEFALPASHFIRWRGAELHYVDEGSLTAAEAGGHTVLMIHGFGGSVRNFSLLAELLKTRYRVIRVDLPGFGLSDFPVMGERPDYIQMYNDYISFILDTLHLDSLYVIGNSMGGGVAWMMAASHPGKVSKLVLLNSAGYDVSNISGKLTIFKYKSMGDLLFARGMPMFMSEGGVKRCFADKSKAAPGIWRTNNELTNREGNIQNMLALARAQQFPDSTLIKKVTCPTLIVWGMQDSVIPVSHADKFHRDIKNSRELIFDTCGHTPMLERPGDVAIAFVKFVEGVDSLQ